jgi:hypothetical protein
MILSITYNTAQLNIDTSMILYAYEDSGICYLYLNIHPEILKVYGVALNDITIDVTIPNRVAEIAIAETYDFIKKATLGYGFAEFGHVVYTNIWANCTKIVRVDDISGDGLLWFDNYTSIQVTDRFDDAIDYINIAVDGKDTTDSSIDDQVGFDVDTYVTDSEILIPAHGFAVRSMFYWRIAASKTADGVASPRYSIRVGNTLSTSDTAILQLTGSPQTDDVDNGVLHVMATVRAIGTLTVVQGSAWWVHKGKSGNHAVGFCEDNTGQVDGTSATFDSTAFAGQYIGLSINAGTDANWTITQVHAQTNW